MKYTQTWYIAQTPRWQYKTLERDTTNTSLFISAEHCNWHYTSTTNWNNSLRRSLITLQKNIVVWHRYKRLLDIQQLINTNEQKAQAQADNPTNMVNGDLHWANVKHFWQFLEEKHSTALSQYVILHNFWVHVFKNLCRQIYNCCSMTCTTVN